MYINTDQYILWFISQLITERGGAQPGSWWMGRLFGFPGFPENG